MYHLFSYQNTNAVNHTSTYGATVFVGNALSRSSYSSVSKFYHKPYTVLDKPFADSSTFDSRCYSMICDLPDLSISTIRTAIANYFPEYLI